MNPPLPELYPPLVLEHARRPRNRRIPAGRTHSASGDNPLCGDQLRVHLQVAAGRIRDIGFEGVCCAVATASASLMTEALMGRDLEHARHIRAAFLELIGGASSGAAELGALGALAAIQSVRSREPCATLPWQALQGVLGTVAQEASAAPQRRI